MKKFKIYWLAGKPTIVQGEDIADACRRGGIGGGAVRAIDFYEEITDLDSDKETNQQSIITK